MVKSLIYNGASGFIRKLIKSICRYTSIPLTISLFLFFQGLTVRRLPLSQECYVSKLDPTLPTPQKLKLDMELVCFVVSYVMTTIYLTTHSIIKEKRGDTIVLSPVIKPQAAQTHVAREGCNVIYITYVTRWCRVTGDRWKYKRHCMGNILLRSANAK